MFLDVLLAQRHDLLTGHGNGNKHNKSDKKHIWAQQYQAGYDNVGTDTLGQGQFQNSPSYLILL